ncbi:MAG: 4Fe-4S dicluster domain-containing protein [Deltaproteobacteria bacterium]|nr:4Fe-4S dicluster domain-containing protein [Deltaproteobacteria bacterium]
MDRRRFLKTLGAGILGTAGTTLTASRLKAEGVVGGKEFVGVLVDTTRCIGCRSCEEACAEAHDLPVPDISDESVFEKRRDTSVTQWTVVNRYETKKGEVFVKRQCMHCSQPGCVAACLVKAMKKRKQGPVTWDENCMGCRYCMVSCPFDIPKFEYNSWNPRIQKCNLCWERLKQGEQPACVEACPQEALVFGTRRELVEEAKRRIYQRPEKYVHHIYGEYEVGGTEWLYLSAVPFEQIGFRTDLGTIAYPEYSTGFLYAVPIVLILWPMFLMGVSYITKREEEIGREGETR